MTDGVFKDRDSNLWFWQIGDLWRSGFKTQPEAFKDYVTQLTDHVPGLAADINGKTWREIMAMDGRWIED